MSYASESDVENSGGNHVRWIQLWWGGLILLQQDHNCWKQMT